MTSSAYFGLSNGSGISYTGDGTSGIYLWGAQLEQASFASSYIPTTSASVTRAEDVLTYPSANNIDGTKGSFYSEVMFGMDIPLGSVPGYGNNYILDMGTNNGRTQLVNGRLYTNDGTNTANSLTWIPSARTTYKAGVSWGTVLKNFLNGTASSQSSFDGNMNPQTSMNIGRYGGSGYNLNGTIKNVKIWKQAMSDAFLQSLTGGGTAVEKKTTISSGQDSILTSGLVGLWSFNGPDVSGTTASDRSGSNNHGTLTNGPVPSPGRVGQALRFDGVDDYVDVGSRSNLNIGTQDFTVALWVKAPTQAIVPKILSSKGDSITAGYDIQLSSGKIVFRVADGTAQQSTSANGVSVDDNTWHHVTVVVRPGVNIIRYVDGTQNPDVQSITLNNITNSQNLFFGKSVTGYWFSGLIDEVRIYNRALSASEVADLYNRGR